MRSASHLADALESLERPPRTSWLPLLVLSLVGFVLLQSDGSESPLSKVAIVTGVLLFHELGHVVAMRLLGWRDVRVFFIPFFGALTTARTRPASRVREALVSFAGPLPGIAVAPVLLLGPLRDSPLAREVGFTALVLNAFNLLPIGFLDGGRLLDRLVFRRHRVLEAGFSALSAAAFVVLGVAWSDRVLGVLGFISLLAVPAAWRRAREAARLRGSLDPSCSDVRSLPEPQLHKLYRAAVAAAGPQSRPAVRAEAMRELFSRATTPHASALACVGFGATWLAAIVATLVVAALAMDDRPGSSGTTAFAEGATRPWGDRPSIFEHVRSHLEPKGAGLTPGGNELPDEARFTGEDGLRFVPGARDAVLGHDADEKGDGLSAAAMLEAIVEATRAPSTASLDRAYALLTHERALGHVDALTDAIAARKDLDAERIRSFARWLATRAPDRDAVKLALAILGFFRGGEDRELFLTLGRHDEFTLHSAVALHNSLPDPEAASTSRTSGPASAGIAGCAGTRTRSWNLPSYSPA